jgi:hypothetical protein
MSKAENEDTLESAPNKVWLSAIAQFPDTRPLVDLLQITPMPDEIRGDIWLNAFALLPDTKLLAALLRTYSIPMPNEVRDSLAEHLDPGNPDICGGRLVYKPTDTFRRLTGVERGDLHEHRDVGLLALAESHHAEVKRRREAFGEEGPSKAAADAVGKRAGYGRWRTVYRRLEELRAIGRRLRGR